MGYEDGTIRETARGFSYDVDKLDNLGVVERNGVRLIMDRTEGRLIVERDVDTLEGVIQDLKTIQGRHHD